MHETIIAKKLIEEAKKHGKVKAIAVEVGELAGIHDHDLEKTLKGMVKWDVKVSGKKAIVRCGCGYRGGPKVVERAHDFVIFECPECKKIPKVVNGDEIVLKEVKVE